MVPPFDIFRLGTDGQPRWIEAVQDFETAKARVASLAENSPGEYIIYSQPTGNKFAIKAGTCEPPSSNQQHI